MPTKMRNYFYNNCILLSLTIGIVSCQDDNAFEEPKLQTDEAEIHQMNIDLQIDDEIIQIETTSGSRLKGTNSSDSSGYSISGGRGRNAAGYMSYISHRVTIGNKADSIYFSIGLDHKLNPEIHQREYGSSFQKNKAEELLLPGRQLLCYSSGFGEFVGCHGQEPVYIDLMLERNGRDFRCSANYQPETSFFAIDSVHYVDFKDPTNSSGTFSYLIQGKFEAVLYEFENRKIQDSLLVLGKFKIGFWSNYLRF